MGKPLTAQQVLALQVSERTMSVLSILGSLFIMVTFIRWHYFRKPINRLVFYASFGNVMANVATLISTSAIPLAGDGPSALCEFQGILIQWFMMADSLWVFCMALNVMLVFFFQYNSRKLRGLEKWYLAFSYGVPFVPAFTYIVYDHVHKDKPIIGAATIWCWVDIRYEWMRIALFYGPVWVCICCTLVIYVATGRTIFRRRKYLREFSKRRSMHQTPVVSNPFTAANLNAIERKTEISIKYTSDIADSDSIVPPTCEDESRSSFSSTHNLSANDQVQPATAPNPTNTSRFSHWATSAPESKDPSSQQVEEISNNYKAGVIADARVEDVEAAQPRPTPIRHPTSQGHRSSGAEGNSAAWSYFKVAFLMFIALFVVWVPSTVNRMQQFIHKGYPIFGLNLASALVLPLQGFWNSMVYISTTWPECKRAFKETLDQIASLTHRGRRPSPSRKNSHNTLSTADSNDFDVDVPLDQLLERGPPPPGPGLHTRLSSTEYLKKEPESRHEVR